VAPPLIAARLTLSRKEILRNNFHEAA